MAKHFQHLREPFPGDPIEADTLAAIIRSLKNSDASTIGFRDEAARLVGRDIEARPRFFPAYADYQAIPAFSIFGVSGNPTHVKPQILTIETIGQAAFGSQAAWFTNDEIPIAENAWGQVRAINDWDIFRLQVTGTTPEAGSHCGPHFDNLGVTKDSFGLICLSDISGGYVHVMRGSADLRVMVRASANIDPTDFTDTTGATTNGTIYGKMNSGTVDVLTRNSSDKLQQASNPKTRSRPYTITAWNPSLARVCTGDIMPAYPVLGVGLVLDPPATEGYGVLSANLLSSSTTGVNMALMIRTGTTWATGGPTVKIYPSPFQTATPDHDIASGTRVKWWQDGTVRRLDNNACG